MTIALTSTVKKLTLVAMIAALTATSGIAIAQTASPEASGEPAIVETDEGTDAGLTADAAGSDRMERRGERRMARMIERLDEDGSGDISTEEFGARRLDRLAEADADGDGTLTVEEITAMQEARRGERREARILARFDIDGDGTITLEEQELQQEKRFALMDRDNDGVLQADEMQHRGKKGGMRGHDRMGGHGGGMGWHHGR